MYQNRKELLKKFDETIVQTNMFLRKTFNIDISQFLWASITLFWSINNIVNINGVKVVLKEKADIYIKKYNKQIKLSYF